MTVAAGPGWQKLSSFFWGGPCLRSGHGVHRKMGNDYSEKNQGSKGSKASLIAEMGAEPPNGSEKLDFCEMGLNKRPTCGPGVPGKVRSVPGWWEPSGFV